MQGEMKIFGLSVAAQPKNLRTEEDRRHSSSRFSVSLPYHHTRTHLNPQPGLSREKDVFGRLYGSYYFVWMKRLTDCFATVKKKDIFCLGTNYIV